MKIWGKIVEGILIGIISIVVFLTKPIVWLIHYFGIIIGIGIIYLCWKIDVISIFVSFPIWLYCMFENVNTISDHFKKNDK